MDGINDFGRSWPDNPGRDAGNGPTVPVALAMTALCAVLAIGVILALGRAGLPLPVADEYPSISTLGLGIGGP